MKGQLAEIPQRPSPHVPAPSQPQPTPAERPMVYVYERQAWEYKIVSRRPPAEAPLTADELNALGRDGWELVGVAAMAEQTQFYFKRVRT